MDTFYYLATHAHAGWRWIVLFLLIYAAFSMFMANKKKEAYTEKYRKLGLFTMVAYHIQFLGGLVLYFISPKVQFVAGMMGNKLLRFFAVEHMLMMTIGMALITVGYVKAKKAKEDSKKFKFQYVMMIATLILVLAAIPWPFREALGGHWF
ncbi:MAG: cytochrome B [Crocinitomicaceae bacterium]|nr:cytochrome B [Crocinitomicaceae bacterium]